MNADFEPTTRDTGGRRPPRHCRITTSCRSATCGTASVHSTRKALSGLIDHEREHGDRTPVLEVLRARMAELENGAEPSPGDPNRTPGVTTLPGASPVQPGTAPEPNTRLRNGLAEQTPARRRP